MNFITAFPYFIGVVIFDWVETCCYFIKNVIFIINHLCYNLFIYYEGWNYNSGNYLFTTDTK